VSLGGHHGFAPNHDAVEMTLICVEFVGHNPRQHTVRQPTVFVVDIEF
jgi:hypothetical protein